MSNILESDFKELSLENLLAIQNYLIDKLKLTSKELLERFEMFFEKSKEISSIKTISTMNEATNANKELQDFLIKFTEKYH